MGSIITPPNRNINNSRSGCETITQNSERDLSDQQSELLTNAEKRDIDKIEEQFSYQIEMELKGYYI